MRLQPGPPVLPRAALLPTAEDLAQAVRLRHGDPDLAGPNVRRRLRWGYHLPAVVYEATLLRLARAGSSWLDVGGGKSPFPDNAALAELLSSRCRLTAVDPSPNVLSNAYAAETACVPLEDYQGGPYDLVTARMVAEHVADPEAFGAALGRLVRPGGLAVVLTVSRHAPLTAASRAVPFGLHHRVKSLFWAGEEEDTFPAHYLLCTRSALRTHLGRGGLREGAFARLDDLSTFAAFRLLGDVELATWGAVRRAAGSPYPECCLLGVYRREEGTLQKGPS